MPLHWSIWPPIGHPVISQFPCEAPLQSTTHSLLLLQSNVQVHPLPHTKLHGGLVHF